MAVDERDRSKRNGWSLCKMPCWRIITAPSSSLSSSSTSLRNAHFQNQNQNHNQNRDRNRNRNLKQSSFQYLTTASSFAKSFIPTRRRLRLDPPNKLYFPYEPGTQVKSAIEIKNTCKSPIAFKFQTTAPKSCFMRPPGGILAPGENLVATVFKFVEPLDNNERPVDQRSKVKFKIMSMKVKGEMEYVPELFDDQGDQVATEQILRVVFLDPDRPCPELDKLMQQLSMAETEHEARTKATPEETTEPKIVGDGLVLDEWKERRERYLAMQHVEEIDLV